MAFRDLTDVLGATSPKVLPIRGASVEFPGVISAWAGQMLLAVRRMAAQQVQEGASDADTARVVLDAGLVTEQDGLRLESELLGDGAQALDDLGVFGDGRQRVISTLMTWHLSGQEAAEVVWEGKAPARNRATRRKTAGSSSRTAGTARANSRTEAGASPVPRKRATKRSTSG